MVAAAMVGVAVVGSVAKGVTGAQGAKKAASQKAAGAAAASAEERTQTQKANDIEESQYGTIRSDLLANQAKNEANYQPYLATGTAANNQLGYSMGLGGTGNGEAGSLTRAFGASDFQEDPGYQFDLKQGQAALDRVSAAKGKYFSGGAVKGLIDYNQGKANQQYQNAYERYNTNQNNMYTKLSGVAGTGLQAANGIATSGANTQQGLNSAGQNYANQTSNNYRNLGVNVGNNDMGAANARAEGTQGATQATVTGINGIQNAFTSYMGGGGMGTAAGTPMSGGMQGPTQGSGLMGFATGLV